MWPQCKQKVPFRCTLCTSRKQRSGKLIDGVSGRWKDLKYFLGQHVKSQQHMRLVARLASQNLAANSRPDTDGTSGGQQVVPCQGISLADDSCGLLKDFSEHFNTWMAWKSATEFGLHSYTWAGQHYEVKHGDCLKTCTVQPGSTLRPVCGNCKSLTHRDSLRKMVVKVACRKFAAELLHARLFKPDAAVEEMVNKVKTDVLYKRHAAQIDKFIKYDTFELQQWVRATCLSLRKDLRSDAVKTFTDMIVRPCLSVNVAQAKGQKPSLLQAQQIFEGFLNDPLQTDAAKVNVAIAQAGLTGKLQSNPTLVGMILTCMKVLDRAEKNQATFGPNAKTSALSCDLAVELASEAGVMLAAAGGNDAWLARFGVSKKHLKLHNFDEQLQRAALANPFLALHQPETIRENMQIIDQKLSSFTDTFGCNLAFGIQELRLFVVVPGCFQMLLATCVGHCWSRMVIECHGRSEHTGLETSRN